VKPPSRNGEGQRPSYDDGSPSSDSLHKEQAGGYSGFGGLLPARAPVLPSPVDESSKDQSLGGWMSEYLENKDRNDSYDDERTLIPDNKKKSPQTNSPMTPIANHRPPSGATFRSVGSDEGDTWMWQDGSKPSSSKLMVNTSLHPPPSLHGPTSNGSTSKPPVSPSHRKSFFAQNTQTWAYRPPPEDMYNHMEDFFPDHDLDKPVIDTAPSGGSSPTLAEQQVPPPSSFPPLPFSPPVRPKKKSIRAAAREGASKITATAQNMIRKRSTKLWGSRVEEVTTRPVKNAPVSLPPESPSGVQGQKPTFKWIKGELIGKGTYGRVFLAFNVTAREVIAVKQVELPKTASDRNDGRQKQVVDALISESDTLKNLDHPNIVQYLGIEYTEDYLSIFLEYVPGGSIGGVQRKHGKFDRDVVRSFTGQVVLGLEYLHLRGIIHRDLKADNILVDQSGVCRISDFGISKRSVDGIYDDDANATSMQGSIFWMAPEVLHNDKRGYNAKIDIWSLGCLVLEMWAGRRPWNQEDMYAVMFKLGRSKVAPPVPEDVELDPIEDDFRNKCFEISPNARPTAAELRKHKFLELRPGWKFTGFNVQL